MNLELQQYLDNELEKFKEECRKLQIGSFQQTLSELTQEIKENMKEAVHLFELSYASAEQRKSEKMREMLKSMAKDTIISSIKTSEALINNFIRECRSDGIQIEYVDFSSSLQEILKDK